MVTKRAVQTDQINTKKAYFLFVIVLFFTVLAIYLKDAKSPQTKQISSVDFQVDSLKNEVGTYTSDLSKVNAFLEEMDNNGLLENYTEISF